MSCSTFFFPPHHITRTSSPMSNSHPLLSLPVLRSSELETSSLCLKVRRVWRPHCKSGDASEADVPSSPEDQDQDDVNMGDGASSPSDGGCSYGLDNRPEVKNSNEMDLSPNSPLQEDTDEFDASSTSLLCQVQARGQIPHCWNWWDAHAGESRIWNDIFFNIASVLGCLWRWKQETYQ